MIKERYVQIDKGHCGGDRTLFNEIKEVLYDSKKFKVTEDTIVFTIIEIPKEQKRLGGRLNDDDKSGNNRYNNEKTKSN